MTPSAPAAHEARRLAPGFVAPELGPGAIHLWWLQRPRGSGRTRLRQVLGPYLGCAPEAVQFESGAHGRPLLRGSDLAFNWSHSGTRALIAIARNLPRLGVDVELLRRARLDPLAVARRYFTATEAAALAALQPAQCRTAFGQLWSAKEAVLKAHGQGISYGLQRVGFARHEPHWWPREFRGDVGAAERWHLATWSVDGGAASLAWRDHERQLTHFRLDA